MVSHVKRELQQKTALVKLIEDTMLEKGWSISELARKARIDKTSTWRIVSKGTGRADIVNIEAILKALDLFPKKSDNIMSLPYKHPELFEMLQIVDHSDNPAVIEVCRAGLEGVLVSLERNKETTEVNTRLEKIESMLTELLELETPPANRTKKPAPGRG